MFIRKILMGQRLLGRCEQRRENSEHASCGIIKNTFLHLDVPSLPRHTAPTHARKGSRISVAGGRVEGPRGHDPHRHTPRWGCRFEPAQRRSIFWGDEVGDMAMTRGNPQLLLGGQAIAAHATAVADSPCIELIVGGSGVCLGKSGLGESDTPLLALGDPLCPWSRTARPNCPICRLERQARSSDDGARRQASRPARGNAKAWPLVNASS